VNVQHDRVNNFDAIRLLGAVLVLVGHAYPLFGRDATNPLIWGTHIQVAGLILFFSLSGYLIATSWNLDSRLLPYLQKRSLRIFPALIVVTLASMFVLGPVLSRLSVGDYLANPNLWQYLKNIVLSPVYALPGVFETTPIPNAVNGSLWSLPAEFACYLFVPLVALLPFRFRAPAFVVLAVAAGVASTLLTTNAVRVVIWGTDLAQATSVWPYFMIGAAIAYAGKTLPLRLDVALVALIAGGLASSVFPAAEMYIWWAVLPYVAIALGSARTPVISRAGRYGDISYGLYLYAFPVQQSLIIIAPRLTFAVSVILTLIISSVLAFASWHLIEKRALKFKPAPQRVAIATKLQTEPAAPTP
jgi:peptidoglycan/LPS O-acetylase OafA/YrhL